MDKIVTQRLLLRDLNYLDSDSVFEYAKDPQVGPNAGWTPHDNIETSKLIVEHMRKSNEVWAIELLDTKKMIGTVGIHKKENELDTVKEIGYVLNPNYWHKGYMIETVKAVITYLFEQTDTTVIKVSHFTSNHPSENVILKAGFKFTHMDTKTVLIYGQQITEGCKNYELTKALYERNELPWQQH